MHSISNGLTINDSTSIPEQSACRSATPSWQLVTTNYSDSNDCGAQCSIQNCKSDFKEQSKAELPVSTKVSDQCNTPDKPCQV